MWGLALPSPTTPVNWRRGCECNRTAVSASLLQLKSVLLFLDCDAWLRWLSSYKSQHCWSLLCTMTCALGFIGESLQTHKGYTSFPIRHFWAALTFLAETGFWRVECWPRQSWAPNRPAGWLSLTDSIGRKSNWTAKKSTWVTIKWRNDLELQSPQVNGRAVNQLSISATDTWANQLINL